MVLVRGLSIAAAGVVAGILGALALNRSLASLLYGVAPTDIKTLIVVAMALLAIAVAATFGPARSGARVDPAAALRSGDYV